VKVIVVAVADEYAGHEIAVIYVIRSENGWLCAFWVTLFVERLTFFIIRQRLAAVNPGC